MRITEVAPGRRLVVILDEGDDLVRSLADACLEHRISAALVHGTGRASAVGLARPGGGEERIDRGPLEIVQIAGAVERKGGRLESELSAVLARADEPGSPVFGGTLTAATVVRAVLLVTEVRAEGLVAAAEPPGLSWAAVAAVSARLPEPAAGDPEPRVGDVLDHPTFGRCVVVRLGDDVIRVRREGGRVLPLGMSKLKLSFQGELQSGQRLFAVTVSGRSGT